MVAHLQPEHEYWIPPQQILEGDTIVLMPLQAEYLDEITALGTDARIWERLPYNRQEEATHRQYLLHSLHEMRRGALHAFVIIQKNTGKIAGMTRFFHLNPAHRQLEIGSWLHPDYWKSGINTEAKLLLLQFCFEHLNTVRVQFRTDACNLRSRKALESMGAMPEGIFRNERIREDGTCRDCAFYSILDREWSDVKTRLEHKLLHYRNWQMAS